MDNWLPRRRPAVVDAQPAPVNGRVRPILGPDGKPVRPQIPRFTEAHRARFGAMQRERVTDAPESPPRASRVNHPRTRRLGMGDSLGAAQRAYYALALAIAAFGGGQVLARHLRWHLAGGIAAMLTLELGGVMLLVHRESRRSKGEHATLSGSLSLLIAALAIGVNGGGHLIQPGGSVSHRASDALQGVFFGAVSAIAFLTAVMMSSARSRDALREQGLAVRIMPQFGAWNWIRHPLVTAGARHRCKISETVTDANGVTRPRLSADDAIRAELDARRSVERDQAIAAELGRAIANQVGAPLARIAVLTYDMDRVAAELRGSADYAGLTRLIASRLTAERIDPTHLGDPAGATAEPIHVDAIRPAPMRPAPGASEGDSPGDAPDAPGSLIHPEPTPALGASGESGGAPLREIGDAELDKIAGSYVATCSREGKAPGQRGLVRAVNEKGAKVGQRRCKAALDRLSSGGVPAAGKG